MAAPGLSLDLRQRRKLTQTLTPALQQSIKLLQLSSLELDAVVREAMETNPLLSLDELSDDAAAGGMMRTASSAGLGWPSLPSSIQAARDRMATAARPEIAVARKRPEPMRAKITTP